MASCYGRVLTGESWCTVLNCVLESATKLSQHPECEQWQHLSLINLLLSSSEDQKHSEKALISIQPPYSSANPGVNPPPTITCWIQLPTIC